MLYDYVYQSLNLTNDRMELCADAIGSTWSCQALSNCHNQRQEPRQGERTKSHPIAHRFRCFKFRFVTRDFNYGDGVSNIHPSMWLELHWTLLSGLFWWSELLIFLEFVENWWHAYIAVCTCQVYEFVKLDEVYYAGSHGMDIRGPPQQPKSYDDKYQTRSVDKKVS